MEKRPLQKGHTTLLPILIFFSESVEKQRYLDAQCGHLTMKLSPSTRKFSTSPVAVLCQYPHELHCSIVTPLLVTLLSSDLHLGQLYILHTPITYATFLRHLHYIAREFLCQVFILVCTGLPVRKLRFILGGYTPLAVARSV